MPNFTETTVEVAPVGLLMSHGWQVAYGRDTGPETPINKLRTKAEVVLARLNPAHREPCLIIHAVNDCHSHRG